MHLHLGAMTRPNNKADIRADIERCYHFFPRLKERRAQQAGTLSGGEQQMLAIARALMLRPKLMLLDEPSFGLAPMITKQIFEILADVKKEAGVSMLVVEQNASLALGIADHAYLIETGDIVMSGEAQAIREDESVRASYLGY
jgi:branched-chain amino acid transport system ATP-binding protein